jgi:hypothetical protein
MVAVDFVLKDHFLQFQAPQSVISTALWVKQQPLQGPLSVKTAQLAHILQTLQTGLVIYVQLGSIKTYLVKAHATHVHLEKPQCKLAQ